MLQLMEQRLQIELPFKKDIPINNIRPEIKHKNVTQNICCRCGFVNNISNNFCTNCGFSLKEGEISTLYHVRMKQRLELLKKGEKAVHVSRVVLYILSVFTLSGIGFFFGELSNRY